MLRNAYLSPGLSGQKLAVEVGMMPVLSKQNVHMNCHARSHPTATLTAESHPFFNAQQNCDSTMV